MGIRIPDFRGAAAIWGATGRDDRGHIWFGVSATESVEVPSAHLFEYIPESGKTIDRGDVVTELKRAKQYRDGEGQMKIHSRIVRGSDGYLYFASMDERGENADAGILPTWGSHWWRLHLETKRWEHLRRVPEGLIAVAGMGRHLFALGYVNHVLYHFDCRTKSSNSVTVGSFRGHISRNLLADDRGHVYVPRLRAPRPGDPPNVTLVEFDSSLKEVAESPLQHYHEDGTWLDNHGIVGFQYLTDRSLVFLTHPGFLYQLRPPLDEKPAVLRELGWIHPSNKPTYAPALFSYDGSRYLLSVVSGNNGQEEWLVYDLEQRRSRATPWDPVPNEKEIGKGRNFYGSFTRDNDGAFYLGGVFVVQDAQPARWKPVLLRLEPPKSSK
jgi:hypothetical protein